MKLEIQLTYSTPEKAYGLRNVDGKTRRFILTVSHVIKVTQISMFIIGLIKNLMICEKKYLLCWIVPKKIKVLLAFS